MIPFLFITIACGAISGFHGLVSSGTTSKQIGCMTDARPIGYGGMLGEGTLGLLAVLAATAGFASTADWWSHYASWGAASGLSPSSTPSSAAAPPSWPPSASPSRPAKTFIAVMVIAFAATSLDTGARIQRLIIAELAEGYGVRALTNRYAAGALGIGAALLLAVTQAGGKGGLILWPLFGTTNQLVAGVTLLVVSVWLRRLGRPVVYTLLPMIFVGGATVTAMLGEVAGYFRNFSDQWLLAAMGGTILVFDVWVIVEGIRVLLGVDRAPQRLTATSRRNERGREQPVRQDRTRDGCRERHRSFQCTRVRAARSGPLSLRPRRGGPGRDRARGAGARTQRLLRPRRRRESQRNGRIRDRGARTHRRGRHPDEQRGRRDRRRIPRHTAEDWDWIVGINLMGVVNGCQCFVPAMVHAGRGGHIVNVSSAAGYLASEALAAYSTTKFAVLGLSEALRDELVRHRIGVTTVCPGLIDTPITRNARLRGAALDHPEARTQMIETYRRRGYGPDRVAENVLKAIGRNRAVAPVSIEAWFIYYLKRFAPWAMAWLAARAGARGRAALGE